MSGVTAAEMVIEARFVLSNLAQHDDFQIASACETVSNLVGGDEAARAQRVRSKLERQALSPHAPDYVRLEAALGLLEAANPDHKLLRLKKLCLRNGIWTVPDGPLCHTPVLYEAGLFGVSAIAEDPEELPVNWCRAAKRVLKSHKCGGAR